MTEERIETQDVSVTVVGLHKELEDLHAYLIASRPTESASHRAEQLKTAAAQPLAIPLQVVIRALLDIDERLTHVERELSALVTRRGEAGG